MKYAIILTALLVCSQASDIFGHALWIETKTAGATGKAHQVKILYGEYAEKEFEATDKWYSDVNTFKLWLTGPDGKKKEMTYKGVDNHYESTFTPESDGVYVITAGHSAKDVDGTTIYQFNASALVKVGKSEAISNAVTGNNELYLQPVKDTQGKSVIVKAFYKGQPASKIHITVSAPSGWSKNFETDEQGILKFEPLGKGGYALEGFYTSQESGTHFDKPYEKIWRCATVLTEVGN